VPRYKELSLKFYSLLISAADDIQAVSVDEALIDVTNAVEDFKVKFMEKHLGTAATDLAPRDFAKEYAESLRSQIRAITGCEGG
jgi:DNA repair protein REV1